MPLRVSFEDPDGLWPLVHGELDALLPFENVAPLASTSFDSFSASVPLAPISSPAQHTPVSGPLSAAASAPPSPIVPSSNSIQPFQPIPPTGRPANSISLASVELECIPFDHTQITSTRDPLARAAYWGAHVFVFTCADLHSLKTQYMARIARWHSSVHSRRGQQSIIVLVVPSEGAVSSASIQSLSSDAFSSAAAVALGMTGSPNSFDLVADRLSSEFASDGTCHIIKVALNHSASSPRSPKAPGRAFTEWEPFMGTLRAAVFSSFWAHTIALEDDVRRSEAQALLPGWNFSTYYVLKEALAQSYETVGLNAEALVVYDELEFTYKAILDSVLIGSFIRAESMIPWIGSAGDFAAIRPSDLIESDAVWSAEQRKALYQSACDRAKFEAFAFGRQFQLLVKLRKAAEILHRGKRFVLSRTVVHPQNMSHSSSTMDTSRDDAFLTDMRLLKCTEWKYTLCAILVNTALRIDSPRSAAFGPSLVHILESIRHQLDIAACSSLGLVQSFSLMSSCIKKLQARSMNDDGAAQIDHDSNSSLLLASTFDLSAWADASSPSSREHILSSCAVLPDWEDVSSNTKILVATYARICSAARAGFGLTNSVPLVVPLMACDLAALLAASGDFKAALVILSDPTLVCSKTPSAPGHSRVEVQYKPQLAVAQCLVQWPSLAAKSLILASLCSDTPKAVLALHDALRITAHLKAFADDIAVMINLACQRFSDAASIEPTILPIVPFFEMGAPFVQNSLPLQTADNASDQGIQLIVPVRWKYNCPYSIGQVTVSLISERSDVVFLSDRAIELQPGSETLVVLSTKSNPISANYRVAEFSISIPFPSLDTPSLIYRQSYLAHPSPPMVKLHNHMLDIDMQIHMPSRVFFDQPQISVTLCSKHAVVKAARLRIFAASGGQLAARSAPDNTEIVVEAGSLEPAHPKTVTIDLVRWIGVDPADVFVDGTFDLEKGLSFSTTLRASLNIHPPCSVRTTDRIINATGPISSDELLCSALFSMSILRSHQIKTFTGHSMKSSYYMAMPNSNPVNMDDVVGMDGGSSFARSVMFSLSEYSQISHFVVATIDPNGKLTETLFSIPNELPVSIMAQSEPLYLADAKIGDILELKYSVVATEDVAVAFGVDCDPECMFWIGVVAGELNLSRNIPMQISLAVVPVSAGSFTLPAMSFKLANSSKRLLVHSVSGGIVNVSSSMSQSRTYVLAAGSGALHAIDD